MGQPAPARVCVDVMGGDRAPDEVLAGIHAALADDPALEVIITGPESVVAPAAAASPRLRAHATTQIIEMDEHPANAVRTKKDSSIVVGCRLVRDGEADAFFSAGSTGACMAAATLVMGRIPGVMRPAIAAVLPTGTTPVVLLDVGANSDCKPEHIVQFAHMGSAYARVALEIREPRIGLLNIGEEPTKGSQLAQDAHALMAQGVAGFIGNIEGRDLTSGKADVIVTDGFTGNVALKLLEGVSKTLFGQVTDAMTSTALTTAAAALMKPAFTRLKARLDPDTYGGAPLLGVNGVCIIGHGSSGSRAVGNAIAVAARSVRGDLTSRTAQALRDA